MSRISVLGLCWALGVGFSTIAEAQTADEVNRIIRSLAPIEGQPIGGDAGANSGSTPPLSTSDTGVLREVIVNNTVIIVDTTYALDFEVYFPFDSAELTPQAQAELAALGRALASTELLSYSYLIAGHTDAVGQASYNQSLSERRAAAVVRYLTESFAISPQRLLSVGFGQSMLRAPSNPRAAINRRVEVLMIAGR